MRTVEIYQKEAQFGFSIEWENFGRKYVTSEVNLAGIPWKVKVSKRLVDGDDVIDLHLLGTPTAVRNTLEWSCEANMTVTLCSSRQDQQPYTKRLEKMKFKKGQETHELKSFIKFADLEPYKQNGLILFEIQLSVSPLPFRDQSKIEQKRVIFQFTLEDVSKLKRHNVEVSAGGTVWSVFIDKRGFKEHSDCLGFFLRDERKPENKNWKWPAKASLKLLSFDNHANPLVREIERSFYFNGDDWGYPNFIKWEDLMNPTNGYVRDDKAIFEMDLEVFPAKPLWTFEQTNRRTDNGTSNCSICLENIDGREPVTTECGHAFCKACITQTIRNNNQCPNCKAVADLLDLRPLFL